MSSPAASAGPDPLYARAPGSGVAGVPRWYAESCLVTDLSVAAVLLTVGFI